jgi:hypothetical protein
MIDTQELARLTIGEILTVLQGAIDTISDVSRKMLSDELVRRGYAVA